ncbi:hypothetical protein LR48_Vigan11g122000 [Vigna angularis]|uniref:Uncharacterized protein n=1 Tax=Phaseolus angularis TaxID=3914 RepID=A0A0L9VSX6_PHAAN|nr:hypothetical protein LR48_Vigan11g122000 [Vigna angularis]
MQRKIRTRSTPSLEPLLLDPEVEKTARRNNSQRRRENRTSRNISPAPVISEQPNSSTANQEMGDMGDDMNGNGDRQARRTLEDYSTFAGPLHFNSIARPRVNAVNMEMKPALIHLVQSVQKYDVRDFEKIAGISGNFAKTAGINRDFAGITRISEVLLEPLELAGFCCNHQN